MLRISESTVGGPFRTIVRPVRYDVGNLKYATRLGISRMTTAVILLLVGRLAGDRRNDNV